MKMVAWLELLCVSKSSLHLTLRVEVGREFGAKLSLYLLFLFCISQFMSGSC